MLTKEKNRISRFFGALGDSTRFKIFELLVLKRGHCVSEIASELKISVPAVSQQLKILEFSGLIERHREGQKICYQVKNKDSLVNKIIKLTKED